MPGATFQSPTAPVETTAGGSSNDNNNNNNNNNDRKESNSQDTYYYFNIVIFCLLLIGMGVMLGYTVFYYIFRDKCTSLLLARDDLHNASEVEWHTKYARALADIQSCQKSSQTKGELQELQGRLQAQAKLSDKHQELLERHERSLVRISELQSSNEASQKHIQALKDQIKKLEGSLLESVQQLSQSQQERDIGQRNLKHQIDKVYNQLQERENENLELREMIDSCDGKIQSAQGKLSDMKNLVQQQSYASVIAMFGEGPYLIRFNLEFPYEPVEPNYFEIKIFNARDMPHTVLTFLTLVENGLYVDTTIDFQENKIIKGGSLASVEPQKGKNLKSSVLRRFAKYGYSAYNTLFFDQESSPNAPCRHSSFGLYDRGPGFIIYLTNDIITADGGSNPNNCPGVIVKGRDTLERILHAHTNKKEGGELTWKVPIVGTYLVSSTDKDKGSSDEL